jgi:predicted nucleic acid-binding protein
VIVVDASAAVAGLLNNGPARQALSGQQLNAPHLVDAEVASVLRRHVSARQLTAEQGWAALDVWRHLGLTRYALHPLLDRIWQLRDNLSAYDAGYVALAELLNCPLLTADARLTRAAGLRCTVSVVPR